MATTMIGPQPNFVPIPNHHPLNYYNYSFNYIPLGIPQCNQSGYAFSNQVKVNNYEGSLIPNCVNSINSQNFNPINHSNVKITNYNQNIYINNHYNKETKRESQTIPTNYNYLDDLSKQINIHNIIMGKDLRTTLMIRHVPNKYSLKNILEDINEEFKGTYDLFYLPVDFVNSCNLGYAFINFINSLYIIQFYENFRGKRWKRYKSDKICELVYGKIQGKNQLIKHFQRGTTMNIESVDKRPLILPTPKSFPIIQIPKVNMP